MERTLYICAVLAFGANAFAQSRPAGPASASLPPAATAPATPAMPGGGGGGTASGGLPTAAEIAKQVDDGQYRDALKSLQRVLDLKGTGAAAYDRAEMLLLRAECQLQIRESQAALATLDLAAKEARGGKDKASNADLLGKALALTALVNKSTNLQYTPKTHTGPLPPKPLNILDRAARPEAYKALLEDILPDAKTKVRAMQTTTTLQPVLDTAKMIAALRTIETVANGAEDESKLLASQLTTRATILLGNSVADMSAATDSIAATANQVYTTPVLRVDPVTGNRFFDPVPHRRGLGNDQAARLRTIQQNCTQTINACTDLGLALDSAEKFRSIATDADGVAKKAGKTLGDDYNRMP
jgi:hypothetical protein